MNSECVLPLNSSLISFTPFFLLSSSLPLHLKTSPMTFLLLFGGSADTGLDDLLICGVAAIAGCIGVLSLLNVIDMLREANAS